VCLRASRRPPRDHRWLVDSTEDLVAAAGHSEAVEEWLTKYDTGFAAIAGRFGRVEPRRQARAFLLGLLSDVDTRSCWQLAEQAGDASSHGMQRLLGEAVWDADDVRDDVRGYAVDAKIRSTNLGIIRKPATVRQSHSVTSASRQTSVRSVATIVSNRWRAARSSGGMSRP